jgi:hypothetical protein
MATKLGVFFDSSNSIQAANCYNTASRFECVTLVAFLLNVTIVNRHSGDRELHVPYKRVSSF